MEVMRGGKYFTLGDLAILCHVTRMAVLNKARKLKVEPIRFGRLYTRYHEEDANKIVSSFNDTEG